MCDESKRLYRRHRNLFLQIKLIVNVLDGPWNSNDPHYIFCKPIIQTPRSQFELSTNILHICIVPACLSILSDISIRLHNEHYFHCKSRGGVSNEMSQRILQCSWTKSSLSSRLTTFIETRLHAEFGLHLDGNII